MSEAPSLSDAVIERFWSKVDKRGADECWPWRASITSNGYGQFVYEHENGRGTRAHRFSLLLRLGREPNGSTLHSCDNRSCVNPSHLREGTAADNAADAVARGRLRSRLTRDQVVDLRRRYDSGESIASMARRIGAPWMTVKKAVARQTWRHIEDLRAA